jgi:tRNA modification GTPase
VTVAIVGNPNAGKSTLLNTFLNEYRAIVSEIAGTTRDTIEEIININGILFRLIDTAGIRENSDDIIENMGVLKSKEKIQEANIVLYLFDINSTSDSELAALLQDTRNQNANVIPVANKTDCANAAVIKNKKERFPETTFISAKLNSGIELLREKLYNTVVDESVLSENIILTNARHYVALSEVQASLNEIRKGIENKITSDFLSLDIRRCLHYLGEITGEISNDDMLDYIFSTFCIGK